jgi:2-octaprenyl-6-methoxyphenol hydroxylase
LSGERLALIAEAAHVVPPIGAQGLNMSLADTATLLELAQKSPDTLGDQAMLDAYHKARYGDISLRVQGIDLLNRASQVSSPALRDARATALTALYALAPVRKTLMQMGLGVR